MMHGYGVDHMGSWGWIGMILMLAFWFGLVWLIIWAIVGARSRDSSVASQPPGAGDPSLRILRERFARGELTPEEFEQARRTLEDR